MLKKGGKLFGVVLISIILLSMFSVSLISAQNETDKEGNCFDECNDFWSSAMPSCPGEQKVSGTYPDCECGWECFENEDDYDDDEIYEDYKDAELEESAGTTPGSTFYFIDKFFDKFGDQIKVKEERIAEIKEMIEAGDIESAKIALEDYMEIAEELEHEIAPEKKEDAKRSAAAIRAVMKDIRDQLPPEERGKFVSDIRSQEHKIATAAEIAGKIKELCVQLAKLDPLEYSKMCKTKDDAPKWQKELDEDLTAEQEEIAKDFVNVMKQCFKTSGQDCACEEIPFYDFSVACSKAAPLATACDIEGDEIACDELDNLDMPELPEWLEPIWEDLEGGMNEAQYDMHMPEECVDAGVTDPKECGKVMIKTHAPLECKAALLEADVQSEIEGRKICDKIMFEQHAPKECIDKGITDPEECKNFMDSFRGDRGPRDSPGFGMDCSQIEDSMERLECYDNKGNEMGEHYGTDMRFEEGEGEITWQCKENRIHWAPDCEVFMREEWPEQEKRRMEEGDERRENEEDWRVKEKECAASCDLENGWWDFRDGNCVCYTDERSNEPKPGEFGGEGYEESECKDGCSQECGSQNTDCVDGRCVCLGGGDDGPQYGEVSITDSGSAEGGGSGTVGDSDGGSGDLSSGSSDSSDSSDSGGDSGSSDSGSDGGDAGITGNVFLDYMNN